MSAIDDEACLHWTAHDLLRFYLAVYDRLIDDDEDVRSLGASMASETISKTPYNEDRSVTKRSLSAPAARLELLLLLQSRYGGSAYLCCEALRRLICSATVGPHEVDARIACINTLGSDRSLGECDESNMVRFRALQDELREVMELNTALFAEEKQNLYIDEVEEARAWSQMLIDMQLWRITPNLASRFHVWTIDCLHALIGTATKELDGPLGWTSKPEVFTLGMRVLLASKVITSTKAGVVSQEKKGMCREALQALLEVALKSQLHPLWIREIVQILGAAE